MGCRTRWHTQSAATRTARRGPGPAYITPHDHARHVKDERHRDAEHLVHHPRKTRCKPHLAAVSLVRSPAPRPFPTRPCEIWSPVPEKGDRAIRIRPTRGLKPLASHHLDRTNHAVRGETLTAVPVLRWSSRADPLTGIVRLTVAIGERDGAFGRASSGPCADEDDEHLVAQLAHRARGTPSSILPVRPGQVGQVIVIASVLSTPRDLQVVLDNVVRLAKTSI